jgi:hypothetical protein
VVVYVTGDGWCGSGGCRLLVLEPKRKGWAVLGRTTITRPPVLRLRRTSHGYRDLGVFVTGGRIIPGYEAALPFDGKRYSENPTIPPAVAMRGEPEGVVLIAADTPTVALYD